MLPSLVLLAAAAFAAIFANPAQGQTNPAHSCDADQKKLTALQKIGDPDVVRLFMDSLACPDVRNAAALWLKSHSGKEAVAGDTRAKARDLGQLTSSDRVISDKVGTNDAAKFYKFSIREHATVAAVLQKAPEGMLIALQDGDGNVLIEHSDQNDKKDYFASISRPAGDYYVVVSKQDRKPTSYEIKLSMTANPPAYSHQDIAQKLALNDGSGEFRARFADASKFRYATFQVARAGLYKFTLKTVNRDKGTDLDLRLWRPYDKAWQEFARAEKGPGRDEVMVEHLTAGPYLLQIYRDAGGQVEGVASIAPTGEVLDPETAGRVIGRHEDWIAAVSETKGKQACIAYSLAKSFSPGEWRGTRPQILLSINPGEADVFLTVDKVRHYDKKSGWTARVGGSVSFDVPVAVDKDEPNIKMLVPCSNKRSEMCISDKGVTGLTRGRELVLKGQTADGRAAEVTYSLIGYRRAIEAINQACRNSARTGWLIR